MKTYTTKLNLEFKKYLTIPLIFMPIFVNAQINYNYLTVDDGLSENQVHFLYRDSKEYLWIGTNQKGLNKYDGSNVKVYENTGNLPGEISNNGVRYIFEDSKNNLWIGTYDGLNLYSYKSDAFKIFKHKRTDTIFPGNYTSCIHEDMNGNLWVAYNEGAGLTKWDYEKNSYDRYRIESPDDDYNVNSMTSIQEDSDGNLWVASYSPGLYKFVPETGYFKDYSDTAFDLGGNYKNLYIDQKGVIWIGTNGKGLFTFDPVSAKFNYFGTGMGNQGLNSNQIRKIIQSDDTHLLIATNQGGINRYDMVANKFEYIVHDEKHVQGLNNNGILDLHLDKEGILWVGTSRGGVNYSNPKEHKFELFMHNRAANSLSYDIVGCFYEDSDGMIWIGTDGGGVDIYDPGTGIFKNFKHDPSDPNSISGDVIRCISEDKDGNMWIGTWESGLNRYDKKTNQFYHYFPNPEDTSSISSTTIWYLLIDHKDRIWLSTFTNGVELFDKEKGVVKRFLHNPDDTNSLSHDLAWQISEDSQHNIWINTCYGINLFDSITNKFTVYKDFPENNIRAFHKDKEGKLWAGSVIRGLFLFSQDGELLEVYNKKNGLPDNTIHAIVEDDNGNLWLSTNKGICFFNKKTKNFKNYTKVDGLQGDMFFELSSLKAKNGKIYFGGYHGFNSFQPDSLLGNGYMPKVYITDFKIFNKSVQPGIPGSPLKYHISETKEIKLSWNETVLSFDFIAINYTHSDKNKYAYKMDGFEKEWNYINDNRRYVTYTNLDPGDYTFRVKASNNVGVWNEEGASIEIIISPPWWKTLFFRLIVIFTILFLIFFFIKYRTYQLRKQKMLLAKMVNERTCQLQEVNVILEEQQEEISIQNEELQQQRDNLQEVNRTLEEQAEEIETQNNELHQHRNYLEKLVKERTADLLAAMKKVKESDRLKSAFLSNMSHEIRTPMNAIIGFSSVLNEPEISESEKEELIVHIKKSSEDLLILIDDILEMSKIQANQLIFNNKLVNIGDLLNDLLISFQLQAQPKGIGLEIDLGSIKSTILCSIDPIRLKQVFSNLIGNAIKFTDSGSVKFGIDKLDKSFITLYVKDTGIGIQEEVGDSIFERFLKVESTKSRLFSGVGLGLSICRDIVKAIGGKIWYESKYGQGTTFYFTIPNNHNITDIDKNKIKVNNFPNLEDKEILIVEDDDANYKVLELYLIRTRAILTWAKNGLEALDKVKSKKFDLVLMDLKLPEMSGVEVTSHIREIYPDQIIVAQTAYAHQKEKAEFLKHNFNGYIEKPIAKEKLLEILTELL